MKADGDKERLAGGRALAHSQVLQRLHGVVGNLRVGQRVLLLLLRRDRQVRKFAVAVQRILWERKDRKREQQMEYQKKKKEKKKERKKKKKEKRKKKKISRGAHRTFDNLLPATCGVVPLAFSFAVLMLYPYGFSQTCRSGAW